MTPGHRCLVCGTPITYRFAICTGCEKVYGNKARYWPEWLRYLWRETMRERRRNRRIAENEIVLSDLEDPEQMTDFLETYDPGID